MRISGMWVKNCIFFVVSTTNGDIREQKSGCVSHQRRCYKLLYKENANLTHLETQPNQYIATTNAAFIFFPGHSSSHLYGLAKPFFRRSFIGRLSPPRGMASTKSESQSLTEFCFENTANLLLQDWIFSWCLNPDESDPWQPSSCFVIWNTN